MNIDILLAGFDANHLQHLGAVIPLLAWAIGAAIFSVAVGVYTFLQMRKMQKKNQPKPNQLDGTIADEGISFYDLAGSPHVYGNITDIWDKSTQAIKKKSGGFLGIGSNSQVTGYRYYASFLAFIGNRIEDLLAINFDKRGWEIGRQVPMGENGKMLYIHRPNIYGENEGGVSGALCVRYGSNIQSPDPAYKKYTDSFGSFAPAYPFQSYISFSGFELASSFSQLSEAELQELADQYNDGIIPGRGFYLGNSGYMKEMLLWVKRIHVRNDGREQWHDLKAEIPTEKIYQYSGSNPISGAYSFRYDSYFSYEDDTNGFQESTDQTTGAVDFDTSEVGPMTAGVGQYGGAATGGGPGIGLNAVALTKVKIYPDFDGLTLVTIQYGTTGQTSEIQPLPGMVVLGQMVTSSFVEGADRNITTISYIVDATESTEIGGISTAKGYIDALASGIVEIHSSIAIKMTKATNLIKFKAESGDINPIHKIREILTDDTAMEKPESDVNDVNFMKAADRIWDEGLGISWAIDEKSCIDAIEELCYHTEAGIRVNRQTGLYEMVLFRDDWFAEEEIHDIAENKIKDLSLEVMNSDDMVNQLNVTYYDRERIKNSAFSVYENGSILTMGHANAESVEFPYFMNMQNAEIVANWKLKQFSTPAWSGSFSTGWKEARKWNRYDLIRLPWSKKWNGTILARIMKINLGNGTDNTVTIDFEEVIPYSGEMNTSIVVDAPIKSTPQPPQPSINAVFEAPYYLTVLRAGKTNADLELSNNPDIGYVAAIAAKPQSNSLNALLYTDGGVGEFEQVSRLDYCDILQLDQPIIETTSSFTVTGVLTQTVNSNNLILLNDELMGFVSFDDETKVLTVKRGVLDTIPKKHNSGNLFIFDLPDVAFDSTQYAQSEIIKAQVLTTTPSGIQELSAIGIPIEIQSRAIRPYPPANVKINGEYWPDEVAGDIEITWADRSRTYQTPDMYIDWFDPDSNLEEGVLYELSMKQGNQDVLLETIEGNSFLIDHSELIEGLEYELSVKSIRDAFESYSYFKHNFRTAGEFIPFNVFIGSYTLPNTNTNATIDLMVPSEAEDGDNLCVILTCRSDRSFTVPQDWSVVLDAIQGPASTPGDQRNRIYVLKKPYNSESTVSFTQIGGVASQAILYVLRGDVVAVHNVANGSLLNATKSNAKNSILAICHSNNFGGTEETETISLSRLRELQSGYSDFKETYYHAGDSNSQYFYYLNAQHKLTDMSSSISLSYQAVISAFSVAYQSVIALEIAEP